MVKIRRSKTDPADNVQADQPAAQDSASEAAQARAAEVTGPEGTSPAAAADRLAADREVPEEEACSADSLQAELQEAKDRALRIQAELENYRKRAAREMQDERRYANLPLMRDLLPVLDNMDRAIEAAEKTHDTADLLEGIKMVAQQFAEVLERHDCVRIPALNEPFDPHLHEAVSQRPSDEHPVGTVVIETQSGFQLHDRVVRPSQVIVSSADPNQ